MILGLRPYPAVKDSGVRLLGFVPAHWDVRPLKHWLGINETVLPDDTDSDYFLEYLDVGSVGTGHLVASPERMSFRSAPSRARRIVSEGDTLVSTVRTYLKAVWHAEQAKAGLIASTGFAVLTPRCGTWSKFVSYVCQSQPFTDGVMAHSIGVAYPAIAETRLGSLAIAVPPLEEQASIARFLDHATSRIDRYIRAKEKLIALLEEQKHVIVHEAVTGRIDVRTGKPYQTYKSSGIEWLNKVPMHWDISALRLRYSQCLGKMLDTSRIKGDHLIPYLRNVDVQWDEVNVDDLPAMDIAPAEYERYTVRQGDLLVCEGGEVGRCAIWTNALEICGFQKALHRLRPHDVRRDLARFLYYTFRVAVQRGAFDDGHRSTIAHLTGEKLRSHRFPFPPTSEQEAIVSFLETAVAQKDQSIIGVRRQTNLMRELRTRLIADAVTGKLDVREAVAALPEKPRPQCTALDEVEGGDANQEEATKMTNWDTCPAVERKPGKVSGAWVFAGTRIPLSALYENLAGGATVDEFVEWFPGVDEQQVRAVLEHEVQTLRAELAR